MHVTDLPEKSQDYLKAIFDLQEWGSSPVTLGKIAERLGQRTSTTSEAIKRLVDKGLLEHAPYADVQLTDEGRTLALHMVRRHRLLETYLYQELGYAMEELHDEAEVMEHAVSDLFITRINTLMGNPQRDPHGDPIPDAQGMIHAPEVFSLAHAEPGHRYLIDRVSDRDSKLLGYLKGKGLLPGVEVDLLPRPYPDLADVRVGKAIVQLPASSLGALLCREAPADE